MASLKRRDGLGSGVQREKTNLYDILEKGWEKSVVTRG